MPPREDEGSPVPAPEGPRAGEVLVRRRYDPGRRVVLADGEFQSLFEAYLGHVQRWELPLDDLTATMMRQGLAGLVLHLSCRPHDESVGLTLNIKDPPLNLFLTGDAPSSAVAGRAFMDGVKTGPVSRLFVQTQRPGRNATESTVDVQGLDVLEIFEQFYNRSEQSPSRFFELPGHRYLMVQSLPDSDQEWVRNLSARRAHEIDLSSEALVRRIFRFQCGCSPARVMGALHTIFRRNPDELFRGDSGVEAFCPRCGARWWIERKDFEATPDGETTSGE